MTDEPRWIAIVTGGGACPGQNAVIRGVVKAAARRGWESHGVLGGFEGLLDPQRTRALERREMGALPFRGGTVLGATNHVHRAVTVVARTLRDEQPSKHAGLLAPDAG